MNNQDNVEVQKKLVTLEGVELYSFIQDLKWEEVRDDDAEYNYKTDKYTMTFNGEEIQFWGTLDVNETSTTKGYSYILYLSIGSGITKLEILYDISKDDDSKKIYLFKVALKRKMI